MLKFKNNLKLSANPVLAIKELKIGAQAMAVKAKAFAPEYNVAKVMKSKVLNMVDQIQYKAFADRTTASVVSAINTLAKPQETIYRTCTRTA